MMKHIVESSDGNGITDLAKARADATEYRALYKDAYRRWRQAEAALAVAKAGLEEIASQTDCGCRPCYGHVERDELVGLANDTLARLDNGDQHE